LPHRFGIRYTKDKREKVDFYLNTHSAKQFENSEEKSSMHKWPTQLARTLETELERLKLRVGMGFEVNMKWLPGAVKYKNGKQLLEEVVGDTIFIYVEDLAEAMQLLTHGFSEWLLNQNTKRYRLLINKLIEVFEQIQYDEKEKIINAMTKLLTTN
jgi:hypothetical protein